MKLIQVLNHFLPYQTAGTEVYTNALSKGLQENGISITIVNPNYSKSSSEEYIYNGLRVFKYAEPSFVDRSLIMGFRKPKGLVSFVSFLKEQKPDIVHFHELAGSNGITLHHVKAAKKIGAKVFFTFHLAGYSCKTGNLFYKEKFICDGSVDVLKCSKCYLSSKLPSFISPILAPLSYLLFKIGINTSKFNNTIGTALATSFLINKTKTDFYDLVSNCDKLIVLTEWYKNILILNGVSENKIELITQALPITPQISDIKIPSITTKPIKLMFLGRISHFKGLHLLIDSINQFNVSEVELFIYGKGDGTDYENNLKIKTIKRTNIHWCGLLKSEEVISTMRNFDALCLCSTFSEMSPLVIQEAFAAGLPVIASNVYGNSEQIVHNLNGLLFQFKNIDSLRDQIQRIIDIPFLVNQLRSNIITPNSFNVVIQKHINLYQSIIN